MFAKMLYCAILRAESKLALKILLKMRSAILKFYNPLITLKRGDFCLTMPFSHSIFYFQKIYPNYDLNLGKIARFIRVKMGYLNMADIGANIGDTAVFTQVNDANFLLIEGERKYADLIALNLAQNYKAIAPRHERERERILA